jgi:hypothetical protein
MKIYEFKHNVRGGETYWVCAPNIKKARDFYASEIGIDSFKDTIVKALTKKELENKYLLDLNESEPDWSEYYGNLTEDDFSCGYLITESFAEYLRTAKHTEIVATTAY